jgi:hypothetical protein
MPIFPAPLGRLRQEDREFKASLGYRERPCLKTKTETQQNNKIQTLKFHCRVLTLWCGAGPRNLYV